MIESYLIWALQIKRLQIGSSSGSITPDGRAAGHSLRNTHFVKIAGPNLQEKQALRHHPSNVLSGKMSTGVVSAQSAAACKALKELAFVANGHSAHLRGHWASPDGWR